MTDTTTPLLANSIVHSDFDLDDTIVWERISIQAPYTDIIE